MANFFQSQAWWDLQQALGEEVVAESGDGWHFFGRMVTDALGSYLYLPYGPVVAEEALLGDAIEAARSAARERGAYRLISEPSLPVTPQTAERFFRTRRTGFNPIRTQIIDLTQSEEEILQGMTSERRKQYRQAERKGMTFEPSESDEDFELGKQWLRATGERNAFNVKDDQFFDLFRSILMQKHGVAKMYVAKHEGVTRVVQLLIDDEDTRYCLFIGRDPQIGNLRIAPPFMVHLMFDAKALGLRTFDHYGLSDSDDVEDDMTGVTKYKKQFGGETVQYAGTWEIPVRRGRYALRRLLDRVR